MAHAAKALAKQARPEVKKPESKKAAPKKIAKAPAILESQTATQPVAAQVEVVPFEFEVPAAPVATAVVAEPAPKLAKLPKPTPVYSFKPATEFTADQTAAFLKMNKQSKDIVELVRSAGKPLTRDEIAVLVGTVSKSRKPWNIFHWYLAKNYRPAGIAIEAKA